jgi:hypothetical protein
MQLQQMPLTSMFLPVDTDLAVRSLGLAGQRLQPLWFRLELHQERIQILMLIHIVQARLVFLLREVVLLFIIALEQKMIALSMYLGQNRRMTQAAK